MKTHYTYAHTKPDGTIFYIGKGKERRAWSKKGRNQYWKRIVSKYGYEVQILAHWDTEVEALDHEVLLISCMKDMGIKLANITDGGEGCTGYKHTEEHKQKMKGNTYGASTWGMTFKGKTHTSEQKAKWAVIRKGVTSPRKGVKLLDSTKEKLRIAKLGKLNLKKRKLTDQEVIEIRQKLKPRNITKLAKEYGVGSTTIARIRDGEAYKEVK